MEAALKVNGAETRVGGRSNCNSSFKSEMPSRRRGLRRRRHTISMLRSRRRAKEEGALIWNWNQSLLTVSVCGGTGVFSFCSNQTSSMPPSRLSVIPPKNWLTSSRASVSKRPHTLCSCSRQWFSPWRPCDNVGMEFIMKSRKFADSATMLTLTSPVVNRGLRAPWPPVGHRSSRFSLCCTPHVFGMQSGRAKQLHGTAGQEQSRRRA